MYKDVQYICTYQCNSTLPINWHRSEDISVPCVVILWVSYKIISTTSRSIRDGDTPPFLVRIIQVLRRYALRKRSVGRTQNPVIPYADIILYFTFKRGVHRETYQSWLIMCKQIYFSTFFDILTFVRLSMDYTDLRIQNYQENTTRITFARISMPV